MSLPLNCVFLRNTLFGDLVPLLKSRKEEREDFSEAKIFPFFFKKNSKTPVPEWSVVDPDRYQERGETGLLGLN
jgi:hypothetical protein